MPEYIERENLIDYLTRATGHKATCDGCCDIDCVDCIRDEVIKNLPTADVVEVVRCKDCEFYQPKNSIGTQGVCMCGEKDMNYSGEFYPYENDFCSYGKVKGV